MIVDRTGRMATPRKKPAQIVDPTDTTSVLAITDDSHPDYTPDDAAIVAITTDGTSTIVTAGEARAMHRRGQLARLVWIGDALAIADRHATTTAEEREEEDTLGTPWNPHPGSPPPKPVARDELGVRCPSCARIAVTLTKVDPLLLVRVDPCCDRVRGVLAVLRCRR